VIGFDRFLMWRRVWFDHHCFWMIVAIMYLCCASSLVYSYDVLLLSSIEVKIGDDDNHL